MVTDGYGKPSKYERNVQRRQSPGLTQTTQASVSFAPLQSLFGIVTPSGLHFERHHQGWWDIDPSKHRLMLNGMVKTPRVFTMDEIMRLPSVSRFHFIECGANTGMEWGNVAVPTAQYTHGMLSCSEFTGVPLITLLELAGADLKNGKFVLAEGADGVEVDVHLTRDRHAAEDAVPVCYCFQHTVGSIRAEIERTGSSTTAAQSRTKARVAMGSPSTCSGRSAVCWGERGAGIIAGGDWWRPGRLRLSWTARLPRPPTSRRSSPAFTVDRAARWIDGKHAVPWLPLRWRGKSNPPSEGAR